MEASARTVVSPQRFSKRNALHIVCGSVTAGAAQRLAVAMQHKRTYLLARTPASLFQPSQTSAHMDLDFKIFDSERLITEVEERPALYK